MYITLFDLQNTPQHLSGEVRGETQAASWNDFPQRELAGQAGVSWPLVWPVRDGPARQEWADRESSNHDSLLLGCASKQEKNKKKMNILPDLVCS